MFLTRAIKERETARSRSLVGNVGTQIFGCDIATEEERTRVFDRSDARYSILARTLAARCDNLKVTVAALEQRLATILETIPQPIATAA
jgi:hypothetical protein